MKRVHELVPSTAGVWLRYARDRLSALGIETASLDARRILLDGLSIPHSVIIGEPELALTEDECAKLSEMLARREQREPVSRILGWREFWGRKFAINHNVLDPRPETEILIETVLGADHLGENVRLLDMGTGSGCIAITLLAERSNWTGVATDISAAALAVAGDNAKDIGVRDRLECIETRWADGVSGPFELICSNPPYIRSGDLPGLERDVRDYDPHLALDGGTDGLDAYREIIAVASALLSTNGFLAFELGAGQAAPVAEIIKKSGLSVNQIIPDFSGHERVVIANRD